jgi:hypothetical protein
MDTSNWFSLFLPVLVAVAVASRSFRVDEEYIATWASSAGLELTEETRPAVRRYLIWSRRSRTVGGLAGFVAPVLYAWVAEEAFGLDATPRDTGGASVLLMFGGYLVGALFAELVINRPGRQQGPMLPGARRLGEYLSHYLLVIQRGLGIACVVLAVIAVLVFSFAPMPRRSPDVGLVALFGSMSVGVAAVIEAAQRVIIGRRRRASGSMEIAADDAMRSSSVHLVAGAGIAILIFFVAVLLSVPLFLVDFPAGVVSFALMLILFPTAIAFWLDSGKPHGFRVRRPEGQLMKGVVS